MYWTSFLSFVWCKCRLVYPARDESCITSLNYYAICLLTELWVSNWLLILTNCTCIYVFVWTDVLLFVAGQSVPGRSILLNNSLSDRLSLQASKGIVPYEWFCTAFYYFSGSLDEYFTFELNVKFCWNFVCEQCSF